MCAILSKTIKTKKKPLSKSEVNLVFNEVKGHRLEHVVHLMFKTGLRIGELLALNWEDIELLEDNLIVTHVNKSIGRSEIGFIEKAPKNRQSIREVYTYDETLWSYWRPLERTLRLNGSA